MKRNHEYDSSSFYSDTFPLILVFDTAFYWRIYLFSSNRRWIDTDTIDLPVMLATDSIDLSVKNFSFLTDSIDHPSEKKIFIDKIEPSA